MKKIICPIIEHAKVKQIEILMNRINFDFSLGMVPNILWT